MHCIPTLCTYTYTHHPTLRMRTDDDGVVVGDEQLAVDVDELSDEASLQLCMGPHTGKGDVVHPLVVHWKGVRVRIRGCVYCTCVVICALCFVCVCVYVSLTLLLQLGDDGEFPSDHGSVESRICRMLRSVLLSGQV